MNCYVHREVGAIGVCSHCGRGVCDACALRMGGKLYCKEDAAHASPLRIRTRAVVMIVVIIAVIAIAVLWHPAPLVAAQSPTNPTRSVPEFPAGTLALVSLMLPAILLFRKYKGVRSRSV